MTAAIVNHFKYVTIGVAYLPLGDIAILSMVGNNKIILVTSVALLQLSKYYFRFRWNVLLYENLLVSDFFIKTE